MGDPLPARHHEQIARTPLEGSAAQPGAAMAFDHRKRGGVGGAIARGLKSLRQQLDEGADGRHCKVAGFGLETSASGRGRHPFIARPGLLQRLAGIAVGIVEDRPGRGPLLVDRQQIVAVTETAPAGRVTFCWSSSDPSANDASKNCTIGISSPSSQNIGCRDLVAVVVPGHRQRDHEVAGEIAVIAVHRPA